MTETEPSAPLPDRDAERIVAEGGASAGGALNAIREVSAVLTRAERAEADNAVLRDRLAQVEALREQWTDFLLSESVVMTSPQREAWKVARFELDQALSAGTPTDSTDETAGER